MARLIFGMNQSLDGYVDHQGFAPGVTLFRHFIAQARERTGSLQGRGLYEVMRYWDEDDPAWSADPRDFAAAWRAQPKWVVPRTLKSVGPNATLIEDDLEAAVRRLKADLAGEIDVGGPALPASPSSPPPAAAAPRRQRGDQRGRGQADLRSGLKQDEFWRNRQNSESCCRFKG